jgi:hypothetical protein
MNNLPQELLDAISLQLPDSDLHNCCTVSRRWQFTVERLTFIWIRLKSTDLERFSDIFSDHHRRESLELIDYQVVLPTYSDKRLNTEAFTEALHGLFRILHSWEHKGGAATSNQKTVSLELSFDSPKHSRSWKNPWQEFRKKYGLFELRHEYSFLRLLNDDLPTVSRISRFQLPTRLHSPQHVDGATLAAIAAKLPNLEYIMWHLIDDDKKFPSQRQQRRYGT